MTTKTAEPKVSVKEPSPSLPTKICRYFLKPSDPSLLAYIRIAYGCLMTFDLLMERGMSHMDQKYADSNEDCRFPLFHGMVQLPYIYMVLIHIVMAWSIVCITFGFLYRFHTFIYMIGYWYIFLLDKSKWNNHSYLFGLFSIMLFYTDAHHYKSIDARFIFKDLKNKHIPWIQYFIPKLQIFLLYFYAALKKTDSDWLMGFSMGNLGKSWPFEPFRLLGFSDEFISMYMVHISGFLIDLLSPFLMLFDKTRYLGFLIMISFHGLNSQLFNIGMFPYTCLATMFIFCHSDSFRKLLKDASVCIKNNKWCFYDNEKPKTTTDKKTDAIIVQSKTISIKNIIYVLIGLSYMALQLFLPYSHFITLGYNGWTQGTYGYSWDMMIHSFATQHTKIYYKDPQTGKDGYLRTDSYTSGRASSRWTSHPDQLYQYATCLNQKLREILDKSETDPDVEIYFDSWKSMNKRFHQRTYDPRVDIVGSNWHPLKKPSYTLPLMYGFDDMRSKIKEMSKNESMEDAFTEVTFIADFPGLFLENFLNADFKNTTIQLLQGQVEVEFPDDENRENEKLQVGKKIFLPADQFHNVHTLGDEPSCYMYVYENNTHRAYVNEWKSFKDDWETMSESDQDMFVPADDKQSHFVADLRAESERIELTKTYNETSVIRKSSDKFLRSIEKRMGILRRTWLISKHAIFVHLLEIDGSFDDWLDLQALDLYFPDYLFSRAQANHRPKRRERHEGYLEQKRQEFIEQWKMEVEAQQAQDEQEKSTS